MSTLMKICLFLCPVWIFMTNPGLAAALKGKVTFGDKTVADIVVMAFPAEVLNFNAPAAQVSAKTAVDGMFALDLPAGQYYLLARGQALSAYYGRNPVTLPDAGLENVNLLMTPDNLSGPMDETTLQTGVAGLASVDGRPVAGAVVTIYPDLSSQLKGMGLGMSAPTDAQGYFEMPLSPGTYYLVVRVRQGSQMAGPLKAGDLFGYLAGNPLSLGENQLARVHIPLIEVPEKVERHAADLFGDTLVSGRVLDGQGRPVADLHVLLYDDPMMLNRPLYVSRTTAADGSFQLSFPRGGHYYLAARSALGGTPAPGELYGRYQGSSDHSINIETGKVLGNIEITVDEVY